MYRRIKTKFENILRKNKDDIKALLFGIYPQFVYKQLEHIPSNEIPIFVFHSVKPLHFERQMRYLSENNYKTLKTDDFYNIIIGEKILKDKSVVLSFDDGHKSLWSTAYPILKKYGFHAVSFILPFMIKDKTEDCCTIEDVWNGKSTYAEIEKSELKEPLCSWTEIAEMHKSGIIDFQSHTSYHHSVFISNNIVDFVNPHFKPSFLSTDINPIIRMQGEDVVLENLEFGWPIYEWAPSMSATRRYIEDGDLSLECVNTVKENGGVYFFNKAGWRRELKKCVSDYIRDKGGVSDSFQAHDNRYDDIRNDLLQSKIKIEEKLNKQINHLCYPWYSGSDLSVKASKDVGYICNYWGILDKRTINKVGDDPYYITRINDDYLLALPGVGRSSLHDVLIEKLYRIYKKKQNLDRQSINLFSTQP